MEILQFVLIGLGIGAIYALVAQGLVLVYRGSGIVNFAQGSFVMVGGYAYYVLTGPARLPAVVALVGAVLIGGLLGAAVHVLVLRPMRRSSPIERVIATLGVLLTLQALAVLVFGVAPLQVTSALPTGPVTPVPGLSIGADRLLIIGLSLLMALGLWTVFRRTSFGRVSSAVAENQRAAASLGHSPDLVATVNWALGAALSALGGALIGPITFLQPTALTMLVVPALAAALIGRFASFPVAMAAALAIGVVQALMTRFVNATGWADSVPFLLIVVVLALRGTSLPLRSHVLERLPRVGDGRIRVVPAVVVFLVLAVLIAFVIPPVWVQALTVTMAFALLCLSVVVVTGYAGQLSLAQFVLAGVGAFVAARVVSGTGASFLAGLVAAMVVTMLVGLLVALPALRTRGINLAVATLGLAVVLFGLVLSNFGLSGGESGIPVPPPTLFGWRIDAITQPYRYGVVVLGALTIGALAVANIRRGRSGRRMLAVRSNERAAAALGVNVFAAKLYAFGVAAALAAAAGVFLSFLSSNIVAAQFDVVTSITTIGVVVVGGVGTIGGAMIGATLLPGGLGSQILHDVDGLEPFLPLVSGLFLLVVLRTGKDGLYAMNAHTVRRIGAVLGIRRRAAPPPSPDVEPVVVEPLAGTGLTARGLTVRFGGVVAADGVDLDLRPGRIHGLIGPNGAGKTTVIDALTGFVRTSAGTIEIGGRQAGGWSARRRSRAGVGRSFQSLELFTDLTVRENLAVACDAGRLSRYLVDPVRPDRIRLSAPARAAVREFGLTDVLDLEPDALAFGKRRLVAIARAVAAGPGVLLLDEPAAGLGDDEAAELAAMLRELAQRWNMAILLVEHNVELVLSVCDEITVLDQGRVLTRGTPAEIRRSSAVVDAYLGAAPADERVLASDTDG